MLSLLNILCLSVMCLLIIAIVCIASYLLYENTTSADQNHNHPTVQPYTGEMLAIATLNPSLEYPDC